jgi:hypothetical protein
MLKIGCFVSVTDRATFTKQLVCQRMLSLDSHHETFKVDVCVGVALVPVIDKFSKLWHIVTCIHSEFFMTDGLRKRRISWAHGQWAC